MNSMKSSVNALKIKVAPIPGADSLTLLLSRHRVRKPSGRLGMTDPVSGQV